MSKIIIKILPDGRERIHWFQRDESGPITTPQGSPAPNMPAMVFGGVKGRIVCMKNLTEITPQKLGTAIPVQIKHSDDPRATTCPDCQATEEFVAAVNSGDYPKE